jgi:hypothetical protein
MKAVNLLTVIVMMLGLGMAPDAFAKRDRREGFNFGTSVRILDTDDATKAGIGSDKDTRVKSSTQAVAPYLGYSTGSFNFGLSLNSENSSSSIVETSQDGLEETTRETDLTSKGASFFSRFLFGKVFFFEAAFGIVSSKTKTMTETKTTGSNGTFAGNEEEYEVSGVGPAYHLGGGLELTMGGGFYFTSAYNVRIVQLRDYNGGSELGKKRSYEQKRELLFGIAHYAK